MVKARIRTDDGISVEVEASLWDYEEALSTTLRAIRRATPSETLRADGPSAGKLRQLIEKLAPETLEYLRLLVDNPEGLTDEQITRELGLETRQKLAGMNGAVTKVADSVGVEGEEIIRRTVSRGPHGRSYHYVIPSAVRAKLINVLPEEPEPAAADVEDVPF